MSEVQEQIASARKAAVRDAVLTRQDLLQALKPLAKGRVSISIRFEIAKRFVSTMSLAWDCTEKTSVEGRTEIQRKHEALLRKGKLTHRARGFYCDVWLGGRIQHPRKLPGLVAELADTIFFQSLSSRNIVRDLRHDLIEGLRQEIDLRRVNNIQHLAAFIRRYLRIEIRIVDRLGSEIVWLDGKIDPPEARKKRAPSRSLLDAAITDAIETGKPFDVSKYENRKRAKKNADEDRGPVYLILPVRSIADPGLKRTEAFVVEYKGKEQLPRHDLINSINRCFDLFLARKYRVGQTETLAQITLAINRAIHSAPLSGYEDLRSRLQGTLTDVATAAVASTPAHSIALLEYRPERNALSRFFVYEHPSASLYRSKMHPGPHPSAPDSEDVSLRQWRNRISAFAFRHAETFDYIYVPNLYSIPLQYRKLGLESIETRRGSFAGVSIPIRRGRLVSGVLNVEARNRNAFDSDLQFLIALARGIATLITSIYQSSDITWLIENIRMVEDLHELKNQVQMIRASDPHVSEAKAILDSLFARKMRQEGKQSLLQKLKELSEFVSEPYVDLPEHYARARRFFRYDVGDDVDLSDRLVAGLEIILKNLCTNWFRYGDKDRDFILVRLVPADTSTGRRLSIGAGFNRWRGDELLDSAFVAPLPKDGRVADGLFILGMVTRALRGTLAFTREPMSKRRERTPGAESKLYLNISLPLE